VLGQVRSREAIEMLLELAGDSSPRVRESAACALDEIKAAGDRSASRSPADLSEGVKVPQAAAP